MRLKSVYISQYKNLKDFNITFDGNSFIDVFVGKNGTGKSNLFEALIEIFRHLYEFDRDKQEMSFEYQIKYVVDDKEIDIAWEENKLTINGATWKNTDDDFLPDNVLTYYSGHNAKVDESSESYQKLLKKLIRGGKDINVHRFINFDRGYKKLLITFLLAQPYDEKLTQKIQEKLGIKAIGREFVITLRRPDIVSRNFKVDRAEEKTLYWGIKGQPREFLRRLSTCEKPGMKESGYVVKDGKKPVYIYYINVDQFRAEFKYDRTDQLVELFNSVKILNMIEDIKFNVTLTNGQEQDINYFSDGQFQSVYLFAIMESFQDRNCITLLDEPDSFLHPEWQYEFLKQTKDISSASKRKNHVLMSTHSPSTVAAINDERLKMFEFDGDTVRADSADKGTIINNLSAGLVTLSENETIMSISTFLKNTTQPVLFTEGISDEYILDVAWKKLYGSDLRPFCVNNAFDRSFLRNMFARNELRQNHPGRILFALFDFDEAYSDWHGLNSCVNEITDPFVGLVKKLNDVNHYAMLVPVPSGDYLKKHALDENNNPWSTAGACRLPIELLFFKDNLLGFWYRKKSISCGGQVIEFIGDKVKFSQEFVPTLQKNDFEIFRPMFEFIKNKCAVT